MDYKLINIDALLIPHSDCTVKVAALRERQICPASSRCEIRTSFRTDRVLERTPACIPAALIDIHLE